MSPKNVDELREKYPVFTYKNYSYKYFYGNLIFRANFIVKPNISYWAKVGLLAIPEKFYCSLDKKTLNNLAFHLGLIEIPSYWLTTCSPKIQIDAGFLSNYQKTWWKNYIIRGLGEFFYKNNIDFTKDNFLAIDCNQKFEKFTPFPHKNNALDGTLLQISGGKDSLVTLELLRKFSPLYLFSLNPGPAAQIILDKEKNKNKICIAQRIMDPQLKIMVKKTHLFGYSQLCGYLAFLSTVYAALYKLTNIIVSHESSSNEGNLFYKGYEINHQYAKTYQFEQLFQKYLNQYLIKGVRYFSLLRPLNELQIAKLFSNYPEYFGIFRSCNIGLERNIWCENCAKCLSIYSTLYPFLTNKQIRIMFKSDLFDNMSLLPYCQALLGVKGYKPFECVGTTDEILVAFYLSYQKTKKQNPLPVLLNYFAQVVLPLYPEINKLKKKILLSWNIQHRLTPNLIKIVAR